MIDFNKPRYNVELSVGGEEKQVGILEDLLSEVGEKVEIFPENGNLRVHVHTDEPELVFSLCTKIGKLSKIKVDDLREVL